MKRVEFHAQQALIPGTWQNRQGRADEWTPAPPAKAMSFFAVVAMAAVGFCALVAMVAA